MNRAAIALLLLAGAPPALASTWPDEDWVYGAKRVADAAELKHFKAARKCGKTNVDGEAVYLTNPPEFMVFKIAKDGTVYRVFNADAERYAIDLCAP